MPLMVPFCPNGAPQSRTNLVFHYSPKQYFYLVRLHSQQSLKHAKIILFDDAVVPLD